MGQVLSGRMKVGDRILFAPAPAERRGRGTKNMSKRGYGKRYPLARIVSIQVFGKNVETAVAGEYVGIRVEFMDPETNLPLAEGNPPPHHHSLSH